MQPCVSLQRIMCVGGSEESSWPQLHVCGMERASGKSKRKQTAVRYSKSASRSDCSRGMAVSQFDACSAEHDANRIRTAAAAAAEVAAAAALLLLPRLLLLLLLPLLSLQLLLPLSLS